MELPSYRAVCTVFVALNVVYGCISWFAASSWAREVLFREHAESQPVVQSHVVYYAVIIGLLCFHTATLALLLRSPDAVETKVYHMLTQGLYWAFNFGVGVYFAASEVYRPEAGAAHALVAFAMCVLSAIGRIHAIKNKP